MEGQELWYFLFGGGSKKVTRCLECIFGRVLYPRVVKKFWVSKTIPVQVCLVALDL